MFIVVLKLSFFRWVPANYLEVSDSWIICQTKPGLPVLFDRRFKNHWLREQSCSKFINL